MANIWIIFGHAKEPSTKDVSMKDKSAWRVLKEVCGIFTCYFSLLGITLGVLLLANPFESAQTFLRIIGVVMIIGSVMELIECAFLMKNLNIKEKAKELRWVDKDE